MRTFDLVRTEDVSGTSGTGRVAQGVEFDDGTCALRWTVEHKSTAIYESASLLERIHGHEGRTKIVWNDLSALLEEAKGHVEELMRDARVHLPPNRDESIGIVQFTVPMRKADAAHAWLRGLSSAPAEGMEER